jgi:hypothetical protein
MAISNEEGLVYIKETNLLSLQSIGRFSFLRRYVRDLFLRIEWNQGRTKIGSNPIANEDVQNPLTADCA